MAENTKWRVIYNPEGDIADLLAYASALVEGRIAGKYLLSNEKLPDTVVIQGFRERGILAGAEVEVDREAAKHNGISVADTPRSGRGGPQPLGTLALSDLLKNSSRSFKAVERNPDDPAVLLYTSGTTGKPKGVLLSHRNFAAQCALVDKVMPMLAVDKVVLVLPLFHVYALSNGLVTGTHSGVTMSLIPQYSPAKLLQNIEKVKATLLIAVPTMYSHLLQLAKTRKTGMPKSLRLCVSGGAPLPLSILKEFEEIFDTRIIEGYGLTETTSAVSLNKSGDNFKPGSIGPTSPGVEMKIVDDEGKDLPQGQVGEIIIRAAVVTQGYWNDPESTAETIKDGWLFTGDLGYMDPEGSFFITDRKKDLIVRGGFNISPREIEEIVLTHPKILDAVVVAVSDKRERESAKLFAVLRDGQTMTERELLQFCMENMAEYKVPKSVEFKDALPKSATGKVLRKELRDGYVDDRLIHKENGGE